MVIDNEEKLNKITESIIGSAIAIHRSLGPGLLESAYEACLLFELVDKGLQVEKQKSLPVIYRDVNLECGYRIVNYFPKNSANSVCSAVKS